MLKHKLWAVVASLWATAFLTGCPEGGVVCREGTSRCADGCADLTSDHRNCGACGVACQAGEVCQNSACQCQAGAVLCNGACVVLASDSANCGTCGNACGTDKVCDNKQCVTNCSTPGAILCGSSCVNPLTDINNCGACGTACVDAQSCHAGKCSYDLVAACLSSGQITGVNGSNQTRGPLKPLGSQPGVLAVYKDTLLAADQMDKRLTQASLHSPPLEAHPRHTSIGSAANQVVVAAPYVYVVNSVDGTLQVLKEGADAGHVGSEGGVKLGTVAELPFGKNTYPQGLAIVNNTAWVPLYGGFMDEVDKGQKLVPVSLTVPEQPMPGAAVDLQALDLKAFDGGTSYARPYAVFVHKNKVYAVLNNLDINYVPGGPGLLARLDPAAPHVPPTVIDLGADCLNPVWGMGQGDKLFVSCAGAASYAPPTYSLSSVAHAGVVMVDEQGARQAIWKSECPAGSGLPDGGTTCPLVLPGRFTMRDNKLYVTDQNAGRIFVLEVVGNSLVERRGFSGDGGAPIQACTVNPTTGIGNVADIAVIP